MAIYYKSIMDIKNQYTVIIIGAGPAGVGTAVALWNRGIKSIALIERSDKIGGIPSLYKKKPGGVRTFIRWSRGGIPIFGEEYAKWLRKKIGKTGIQVWLQSQVLEINAKNKQIILVNPINGEVKLSADAIIMACGSREETPSERGWLAGGRPMRVFFTKQLLHLIDGNDLLPMRNPIIIGSDLIAYAAAAKLKSAGSREAIIIDNNPGPKCSWMERLYFRLWSKPHYRSAAFKAVEVVGSKKAIGIKLTQGDEVIPCDGIVICGELIPNSELALQGELKVDLPSRIPVVKNKYQLSKPGWFVAGNMLGGFHGAEWCYYNGWFVARSVKNFLSQ